MSKVYQAISPGNWDSNLGLQLLDLSSELFPQHLLWMTCSAILLLTILSRNASTMMKQMRTVDKTRGQELSVKMMIYLQLVGRNQYTDSIRSVLFQAF